MDGARPLEACGMTKISCPLFTITLAKGRESVVVDDENSIPDDLMRVKTEIAPDKTAIAAKLKAGEEVPGARLERGQSSIRLYALGISIEQAAHQIGYATSSDLRKWLARRGLEPDQG